ncbi:hypothetical protein E2C01_031307 [Portunus trituberculatus]|uniref:Uncharacterized protein n=1 Tax=Portunus trituberculatus TaxID=210409 RepID=A0A5B7EZQ9_PORTR|nr:hypothetical protein [Portunus trituberculatus]
MRQARQARISNTTDGNAHLLARVTAERRHPLTGTVPLPHTSTHAGCGKLRGPGSSGRFVDTRASVKEAKYNPRTGGGWGGGGFGGRERRRLCCCAGNNGRQVVVGGAGLPGREDACNGSLPSLSTRHSRAHGTDVWS